LYFILLNQGETILSEGLAYPSLIPYLFQKAAAARQWLSTPMDYISTGLLGPSSSRTTHHSSGFQGQIQLGN